MLRLGTGDPQGRPDTPVVERFAETVEELSEGAMRVEVVWEAGENSSVPDGFEQGVVQLVQDGDLDLGWIAARAWDTVGVTSFQALQAPFLITDQGLLTEVLASPMADEMVAGLEDAGVVGLGLYQDGMRYPLGYAAPMTSLEDFDGADIRLVPSEATEALVRALGGRPVYGFAGDALEAAIANGDVDGTEVSLGLASSVAPEGSVVTGNVVLFPRVNTLFAGQDLMASLSEDQAAILAAAAEEAQAFATSSAIEDFAAFCDAGGEVTLASEADAEALERAAIPGLPDAGVRSPDEGVHRRDPGVEGRADGLRRALVLPGGLARISAPRARPIGTCGRKSSALVKEAAMSRRLMKLLVVTVSMGVVAAACSSESSAPSATGTSTSATAPSFDLKLGNIMSLTGDLGTYGPPIDAGAQAAIPVINDALAEAGVTTVTVEIVATEDDQTDAKAGVEAATKLIQTDAVDAIIGPLASTVSIRVAQSVAVPNNTVVTTPSASASNVSAVQDNGYLYRTAAGDAAQAHYLVQLMGEAFGADATVNVGVRNDDYGVGLQSDFSTAWEEAGGTIGESVAWNADAATFDTEAQTLAGGEPDAWLIVDFPETFAKVAPALVRAGGWIRPGRSSPTASATPPCRSPRAKKPPRVCSGRHPRPRPTRRPRGSMTSSPPRHPRVSSAGRTT